MARRGRVRGAAARSTRTARTVGLVTIAAAVGIWVLRSRALDGLTDKLFRRPSGLVARRFYREARPHQDSFRETLAALALEPDDRLLELGCGGGTFLEWALTAGCTARAVDHSPQMLSLAAARNRAAMSAGRLELREADVADLPFADGSFTAVATMNAFFFFDAPAAVLAETFRTLAPAGRIAICTTDTAPPPFAHRMHLYTDDELTQLLEQAGYEQISIRRTGPHARTQLVTARKPAPR